MVEHDEDTMREADYIVDIGPGAGEHGGKVIAAGTAEEMLMVPGMIFTIEPMVNMGQPDIYVDSDNDWEVYTDDGLPSAQWEIMVLVTEDGHEVLCW